MRRMTRPTWPTHKAKRHRPRARVVDEPRPRQKSPAELARDLVRRGLASEAILDPRRLPREDRRRVEP